jgi:1-acyl-sn-glycerol-3-phosphate acyltransferase
VSIIDSLRVAGAMARITAPSLVEAMRGTLTRASIDERARWFGRRVVELLDIDLIATGADRVPSGRAYVYMSNHQSHLDVAMLYATLPSPTIRMLAKKELFEIPLWGRGIRAAEFIEVDRQNHARAIESIHRAQELLNDHVSIWMAPEGTRSYDGKIGPLKKGGFHLALDAGVPIVPVAIRGTMNAFKRGARSMKKGQRVEISIGVPIDVAGRDLDSLIAEVTAFLKTHVER